jgi:hypothetical protein
MTKITYEIVEHDGGWAYKVGDVFSEPFLDVRLGPIGPSRPLVVPAAILVLVRNLRRFAWDNLLARCTLGCFARSVVG